MRLNTFDTTSLTKPYCSKSYCSFLGYRNVPKFSDRQAWANSVDPDQTAPRRAVWSGSTLFAVRSALFGHIILQQSYSVQILGWLQQVFSCLEFLGVLRVNTEGHSSSFKHKSFFFSAVYYVYNKTSQSHVITSHVTSVFFNTIYDWATSWEQTIWPVHPAKTQINLGIHPVWSVFAVRSIGS